MVFGYTPVAEAVDTLAGRKDLEPEAEAEKDGGPDASQAMAIVAAEHSARVDGEKQELPVDGNEKAAVAAVVVVEGALPRSGAG